MADFAGSARSLLDTSASADDTLPAMGSTECTACPSYAPYLDGGACLAVCPSTHYPSASGSSSQRSAHEGVDDRRCSGGPDDAWALRRSAELL